MHVAVETVSPHPSATVWREIADFGDIHRWHPAIAASRLHSGTDAEPGCVRELTTADGATLTERLVSLDAAGMEVVYEFVEHPFPVTGYRARMKVLESGDRTCLVQWSAEFEPTEGDGRAQRDFFAEKIFGPGLLGLNAAIAARQQ
ncbi:SRPBCC family protein [Nocardia sp. NPDC048505]|uniref:SRPBCC family protein n=1 Tax=unclassified Nocardia TaxID=2637762 RepID=UPI0033DEC9CA